MASSKEMSTASSMSQFIQDRVLGRGGFGKALLVKDKATGKWYVIKRVNMAKIAQKAPDDTQGKKLEAMVFQEATLMQKIEHENVVKVYSSFMENDKFHIVMEYCDGGTLKRAILKRRAEGPNSFFAEDQICHWMAQIGSALTLLHDRHIMHRDVKSENIFMMADGETLKLGDFGVSRILDSSTKASVSTIVGTASHMAPEVLLGKPYGYKSDVWAFGVVAYELTTLKLPFPGRDIVGMALALASFSKETIPPIPQTVYSEALRNLIEKKMLVRDVDQRAKMAEVNNDIKRLTEHAEQKALTEHVTKALEKLTQLEEKLLASEQEAAILKQANIEASRKIANLEAKLLAAEGRADKFEFLFEQSQQAHEEMKVRISKLELQILTQHNNEQIFQVEQECEILRPIRTFGINSALQVVAMAIPVDIRELFEACYQGNTDRARSILEAEHVDVNAGHYNASHGDKIGDMDCSKGTTCLIFAVYSGNVKTVAMLVNEFRANVDQQDEYGCGAIHVAAENGNLEIVQLLCEDLNAKLELETNDGETALMKAAYWTTSYNVVEYLLKRGANANHKNKDGKTVVQKSGSRAIKQLLTNYNATL